MGKPARKEIVTLADRRERLGITQKTMALMIGCAQGTVSKCEAGHVPDPELLEAFMKHYRLESRKQFIRECEAGNEFILPLWRYAVSEQPATIEVIHVHGSRRLA